MPQTETVSSNCNFSACKVFSYIRILLVSDWVTPYSVSGHTALVDLPFSSSCSLVRPCCPASAQMKTQVLRLGKPGTILQQLFGRESGVPAHTPPFLMASHSWSPCLPTLCAACG